MTERYLHSTSATGAARREGRLERGRAAGAAAARRPRAAAARRCARLWSVAGAGGALRGLPAAARRRPRCASASPAGRSAGWGRAVVQALGGAGAADARAALRAHGRADARAAAPSSPTIRAGSTSWRCSGRRRRSWSRRPRCGLAGASGIIGRAIGTMFIDRRPAEAKRQEAELLARLARGDRMAIFPEGTSTDGQRVLPFKSSLFGVFFAPELERRRRGAAGDDRLPPAAGPAGDLLRLVGRDGLRQRTCATCWRARPAAWSS